MSDLQSLLSRARSAETVEEECNAIWAAVLERMSDAEARRPLYALVVAVRSGRAPRATLLGVVAALVPEGMTLAVIGNDGEKASAKCGPSDADATDVPWFRASTSALAALGALLTALEEAHDR